MKYPRAFFRDFSGHITVYERRKYCTIIKYLDFSPSHNCYRVQVTNHDSYYDSPEFFYENDFEDYNSIIAYESFKIKLAKYIDIAEKEAKNKAKKDRKIYLAAPLKLERENRRTESRLAPIINFDEHENRFSNTERRRHTSF